MNVIAWARTQWDRLVAWVLAAIGGLAILIGWQGVSTEALAARQIPYLISGGIGGLFLLGLGATVWLSADLRDEWRRLESIDRRLKALGAVDVASVESRQSGSEAQTEDVQQLADGGIGSRRSRQLHTGDTPLAAD